MINRLLPLTEVVRITGKSKATIYVWIRKGIFPPVVKFENSRLWPEEDVLTWRKRLREDQTSL